ncbi:MAG: sodium:solute symporter family protein [Gemmatimonadota bacterium]
MRILTPLDWAIVVGYLGTALLVGFLVSRQAGRSIESYFVAGRDLPWWWLGTSMVATTFAADTPLVVTGLVASYGVAGNWFWWSWAIAHVSVAVVFAALWRRSRVITDAELIELRYAGPPARFLRAFKAIFFAVLINGIILGWVIRAMTKISTPFVHWDRWLGESTYAALVGRWPEWLIFGTVSDTLTILALFSLIALYSSLGGIRGVILTDLLQFTIAIVASFAFAWIAMDAVGGLAGLRSGLEANYESPDEILAFIPTSDAAWLPVQLLAVYLGVQWWAQYFSDGSGYLAQRLFTARSDADAEKGGLWFAAANYGLRTWPWVLVALVALVLYPLGAEGTGEAAQIVAGDREMAYPILMADLLPAGILGLLFASLLAAFMSTVDTHLNWGASYLVNDIYRRFIRPGASQRELVGVSRTLVVALAVLAILVASQISSIEQAWRFFIALGAGLGLPGMLRWVWWRINAWTEIVGMSVASAAAFFLYWRFPDAREEYLLVVIVAVSMVAAFVATFVTRPTPHATLEAFVQRVRPPGFWGPVARPGQRRAAGWLAVGWTLGNIAIFSLLFGCGWLLLGSPILGAVVLLLAVAAYLGVRWALRGSRAALREAGAPDDHVEEALPAIR